MPTAEAINRPTFRTPKLCTDILLATDIPEEDLPNWIGWQEEGRETLPDGTVVDRRGPAPTKPGRHYLLIGRGHAPFTHEDGFVCTPGGFVDYGEDPAVVAERQLEEETRLPRRPMTLIGVYGKGDRDPRGHCVSIAYGTVVTPEEARIARGDDDAFYTEWVHEDRIPSLTFGFDHGDIVIDGSRVLAGVRA